MGAVRVLQPYINDEVQLLAVGVIPNLIFSTYIFLAIILLQVTPTAKRNSYRVAILVSALPRVAGCARNPGLCNRNSVGVAGGAYHPTAAQFHTHDINVIYTNDKPISNPMATHQQRQCRIEGHQRGAVRRRKVMESPRCVPSTMLNSRYDPFDRP